MAVSLKVEEGSSNDIKETNKIERYSKPLLIVIGILFIVTLLSCIICITYQLYNPVSSRRAFTKDDEDDMRIKLYKIQSDYYINGIDREEAKFNTIHDNFNSFLKLVSTRKPECTRLIKRHSPRREIEELERITKNNLYHFKQTLNGWVANFNYIDLDGTLYKLMNDYESNHFRGGNRPEEKDEQNFKRFREFYDQRIQMLEDCVLSASLRNNARLQHQELRQQIKLHENEIETQYKKFELLSEEIIRSINQLTLEKIYCLREFPIFWQSIQKENALAEQLLDVLKFKLKKLKYESLMTAGSIEKIEELVEIEKNLSRKLNETLDNEIEMHYKNAKSIYEDGMKDIETCSFFNLD